MEDFKKFEICICYGPGCGALKDNEIFIKLVKKSTESCTILKISRTIRKPLLEK